MGGGVGWVGGGFQFGDEGGLGGVDLGEFAADGGGLLVPAFGLPGGAGRQLGGEHGGPVRAEDPLGEEPGQHGHHRLFADGHGAVAGIGGVVAGQAGLVRAPVVGQGAAVTNDLDGRGLVCSACPGMTAR